MADLYGLTGHEVRILKGLIEAERRRPSSPVNRPPRVTPDTEEYFTPEVYLAQVPSSGIRALEQKSGGRFRTHYATCLIHRAVPVAGTPQDYLVLEQVPALTRDVYNYLNVPVQGNGWVLTARDKFGTWWVTAPCCFSPDEPGTGTGTGTGTYVPNYLCPNADAAGATTCHDGGSVPNIPLTLQMHGLGNLGNCSNGGVWGTGFNTSLNYLSVDPGLGAPLPAPFWHGFLCVFQDLNSADTKPCDNEPLVDPPHLWRPCTVKEYALYPCASPPALYQRTEGEVGWSQVLTFCFTNSSCRPLAWYFKYAPHPDPCLGPELLVTA